MLIAAFCSEARFINHHTRNPATHFQSHWNQEFSYSSLKEEHVGIFKLASIGNKAQSLQWDTKYEKCHHIVLLCLTFRSRKDYSKTVVPLFQQGLTPGSMGDPAIWHAGDSKVSGVQRIGKNPLQVSVDDLGMYPEA